MGRRKCIICGRTLERHGQQICINCAVEKADRETAEKLRDIADVLSITANTDGNIKQSMEAIIRIADRLEGKQKEREGGRT